MPGRSDLFRHRKEVVAPVAVSLRKKTGLPPICVSGQTCEILLLSFIRQLINGQQIRKRHLKKL